mmetsp:Transcript_26169/g.69840  ORF Transcript_26169/g.69840 Transcript_26169/m.69840 type:complete len:231 (-) Transcript_26169:462-1154(-)
MVSCRLSSCRRAHRAGLIFRGGANTRGLRGLLLARFPDSALLCTGEICQDAGPVLPALDPLAAVDPAVGPEELPLSALQVVRVPPDVPRAVGPHRAAVPRHPAAPPLPAQLAAVRRQVAALSLHGVVLELPVVRGERAPVARARGVGALPVLAVCHVAPLVPRPVWPRFDASATLFVALPLALVGGAVDLHVLAVTVGLVRLPLSQVSITVGGQISAVAVGTRLNEGALV